MSQTPYSEVDTDDKFPHVEKPGTASSLLRRSMWPLCILICQGFILSGAVAIFAIVKHRGQISLNFPVVDIAFVQQNPQVKNYITTLIATIISTISTYLFAQSIRHILVVALIKPIRISSLAFSMTISNGGIILNRREYKWSIVSVVMFIGTLGQTASWTTFLTPTDFTVQVALQGTDFDTTSPAFQAALPQYLNTTVNTYLTSEILSIIDSGGATRAAAVTGYPAVLDYFGFAYDVSSMGILPVVIQPNDATPPNHYTLITTNTQPIPPSINPLGYNLTMVQQGLTGNVSCQIATLSESTTPSITRQATASGSFTQWTVSTDCSGQPNSQTALSATNNTLFLLGCEATSAGQTSYVAILDGQGAYNGTWVCTIAPQIRDIIVNYSGFVYTAVDVASPIVDAGPLGFAGFYALQAAIGFGQSEFRNSIGDTMKALADQSVSDADFLQLLDAYMDGVFEFTGTAVKTRILKQIGAPTGSMQKTIAGHAFVETLGWQYKTTASIIALLPIAFTTLVSIALVGAALFINFGEALMDFDPNDPAQLMAASSTGGMVGVFKGVTEEQVNNGKKQSVQLGFNGFNALARQG
ncbi:hypothetical protein GGX14DRAFT_593064 [Mycena pura]|uniref:Uncharacterized protein n=1 Tax=Mycena pura TaxID=153505 RepID=A0AAD6Y683_9AGAR|nr:hypothetical protein GGX14DRAFT_593064 [Mycena pura]